MLYTRIPPINYYYPIITFGIINVNICKKYDSCHYNGGAFPLLIAMATIFFAGGSYFFHVFKIAAIILLSIVFSVGITFFVSKFLSSTLLKADSSIFTLEMPPFRRPQIKKIIVRSIFDRTIFILGRAVLFAAPAGAVIWLLQNISVNEIPVLNHAAGFLNPFAEFCGLDGYILLAFILGLPANEIVIPILIMLYTKSGMLVELNSLNDLKNLLIQNNWTWLTALLTMVFSLNHFPCATTLLTIKKETQSLKWTFASFIIPTAVGLICCIIINWAVRIIDLALKFL